ncbi:glycine-rich protein-like [Prunus yedoensis var. nudiflora]|uniref:Glycine-rich protein-like n=1 Tax=Prunus yedoensis var. nudiflora TaxID=2094558 RepID=A0A314V2P0_PRUYE|nr:glycine-rich protein-like [Prunus yedoensis var. nudiflora]
MGSKAFIYCGLLLAIVLLISSEVAANAAEEATNPNVGDAKYGGGYQGDPGRGGYGGNPGHGGYGGNPGRGGYGGGGGGGGGRCYYGCCRRSYNGRECVRCCNHANEAVDAQPQN